MGRASARSICYARARPRARWWGAARDASTAGSARVRGGDDQLADMGHAACARPPHPSALGLSRASRRARVSCPTANLYRLRSLILIFACRFGEPGAREERVSRRTGNTSSVRIAGAGHLVRARGSDCSLPFFVLA
jgi:hypothetical protein